MSSNIEQEIKLTLCDPNSYAQVITELDRQAKYIGSVTLTSTYFDTATHELAHQKACMRLRELKTATNISYTATLKAKSSITTAGVFRAIEEEVHISKEDYHTLMDDTTGEKVLSFFKNNVCDLHTVLDNAIEGELAKIASFTTMRRRYTYKKHTVELDNVIFIVPRPGRMVELECETEEPQKAMEDLRAFFSAINVMFTHSTTTKLGRAMSMSSSPATPGSAASTPRHGITFTGSFTGSFSGSFVGGHRLK